MRFVLFYHSLISDWNHGNAHFLRGVVRELQKRGHRVDVFEPADGWSLRNLREQHGTEPLEQFRHAYPSLRSTFYDPQSLDLEAVLDAADVVIVHEWNEPSLVARIGECRARGGRFQLLFHDTHHRAVSEPEAIRAFDLAHYDGVLAFGEVLRQIYQDRGYAAHAWTWHEAADVRLFRPPPAPADRASTDGAPTDRAPAERPPTDRTSTHRVPAGRILAERAPTRRPLDLVWIGNWGEGERAAELREFLIEPVAALALSARLHGVRYPEPARKALEAAGIDYRGWLPNFHAPTVFAEAKMTVHVPRRFYAEHLPGIPTIRVFEALACGIPLVSAPWEDSEHLFRPGEDYLVARNGKEMCERLRMLKASAEAREQLAQSGVQRILERHTCAHRVDELLSICKSIQSNRNATPVPRAAIPEPRRAVGSAAG